MPKMTLVDSTASFKKKIDDRTHEKRLSDGWVAFGELKNEAIRTGNLNSCSTNKVCKKAKLNKTYLTGVRKYKDEDLSLRYQELNKAIQTWRSNFKKNKTLTEEQKLINELEEENKNLKNSVAPYIEIEKRYEFLNSYTPEKIKELEETVTILRARLDRERSNNSQDEKIKNFGMSSSVARMIISPDLYRQKNGRYTFEDELENEKSFQKAYDKLLEALSRGLKSRFYLLVGLPCSGKTTWAENAHLNPDRHPVIFDATNLSRADRIRVIYQIKGFKDLEKCCVIFDTPMTEIRKRNLSQRTSDRQIADDDLEIMNARLEKPDPYKEDWIDELIVVRQNG